MVQKFKTIKHYEERPEAHELTFTCYDGKDFLLYEPFREILAEFLVSSLRRHHYHLWAYVLMPNHVHLLVWPAGPTSSLVSDFLKGVKFPSGKRCLSLVRERYPDRLGSFSTGQKKHPYRFWQQGPGHDRNIVESEDIWTVIQYIHNNPVRKGLVDKAEDWKWSSARDWAGLGEGPIPLDKGSLPV